MTGRSKRETNSPAARRRKQAEAAEEATLPSFEESLERLEQIVKELEGEGLTLEETLVRYEEGAKLVRECTRRVEQAELRIRTIAGELDPPVEDAETEEDEEDDETDERLPF